MAVLQTASPGEAQGRGGEAEAQGQGRVKGSACSGSGSGWSSSELMSGRRGGGGAPGPARLTRVRSNRTKLEQLHYGDFEKTGDSSGLSAARDNRACASRARYVYT